MKKSIFLASVLIFICSLIFQFNTFGIAPDFFFDNFQDDSENLVLGKILADKMQLKFPLPANLGEAVVVSDGTVLDVRQFFYSSIKPFEINKLGNLNLKPYRSQFGGQGIFFSFLYNDLGVSFFYLRLLSSFLMGLTQVLLTYLIARYISLKFGFCYFSSIVFSPWIVSFSNNLYWCAFLWFLPAAFSLLFSGNKSLGKDFLFGVTIFVLFFIKSLCGYEYLSSIVIFSAGLVLIHQFKCDGFRAKSLVKPVLIGLLGASGFIAAILLHASMKNKDIIKGLNSIFIEDVKRRTYGEVPIGYADLGLFEVLYKYFFEFKHFLFMGGPVFFVILNFLTIGFLIISFWRSKRDALILSISFLIFLLAPVSWFVLAKGHSANHYHMNYVLWSFGYVGFLIYSTTSLIIPFFKRNYRYDYNTY